MADWRKLVWRRWSVVFTSVFTPHNFIIRIGNTLLRIHAYYHQIVFACYSMCLYVCM